MVNARTEIPLKSVGIGLRRKFIEDIAKTRPKNIDFFEIAPENYIERGGLVVELLEDIAKDYPIVAHGLSLSIGSVDELNWDYLKKLKAFLQRFDIPWFSDHLCFSSVNGSYLHDLLPLPFTKEAIDHVSERAKQVQDFLERPFALENVSYYVAPEPPQMTEYEFIASILDQSGVSLMLDVNNIYVNSINHGNNASDTLKALSSENILQLHIAGHRTDHPDLIIDTHGSPVCEPVWELLRELSQIKSLPPLLIERDTNIPELTEVYQEIETARKIAA